VGVLESGILLAPLSLPPVAIPATTITAVSARASGTLVTLQISHAALDIESPIELHCRTNQPIVAAIQQLAQQEE
jgi:hypothetical protein